MNEIEISNEFVAIAEAMRDVRGDLAKASRSKLVNHNAMALRRIVKDNPIIRRHYHVLLAEEMQEKGLHIAERILAMVELQGQAMGHTVKDMNGGDIDIPADINQVIALSKEISRLIAEGKGQSMSTKQTLLIASKEDAQEILAAFLNS